MSPDDVPPKSRIAPGSRRKTLPVSSLRAEAPRLSAARASGTVVRRWARSSGAPGGLGGVFPPAPPSIKERCSGRAPGTRFGGAGGVWGVYCRRHPPASRRDARARLNRHDWKSCEGETLPGVRIPLSPPAREDSAPLAPRGRIRFAPAGVSRACDRASGRRRAAGSLREYSFAGP